MGQLYVPAKMRTAATDIPVANFEKIFTSVPHRCDHVSRICATKECISSWAQDWNIYLRRNVTGREWIAKLQLTDLEVTRLCDDVFPRNEKVL